jgi:hypothetical protein
MGIQIGAKPDSGFDDPIGMLKDCHRRIASLLGILCVVVTQADALEIWFYLTPHIPGCVASFAWDRRSIYTARGRFVCQN